MAKYGLDLSGKTYWLVGASAGIGAALAKELDNRGANLVVSARSVERLGDVAASLSNPSRILPIDVTESESVECATRDLGHIDGVVYIAGEYTPMSVEDWNCETAIAISEVNYTGALRVLSRISRQFSDRNSGHIVVIGSLAGFAGLPGAIGYGASKAAVMHLAENMRADLKGTGVKVQVANPGFVKTRLTDKNDFKMPFIQTPETAAKTIANHMQSSRFSKSFPGTFSWFFKLLAIGRVLRA